jgi:5'-nucleotidase
MLKRLAPLLAAIAVVSGLSTGIHLASLGAPALEARAYAAGQTQDDAGHPRVTAQVIVLQMNDVYSTVPVDGLGGLARVAALKRRLAADGRSPVMMLAGDFLSSSVASTVFKGEQMIAALNAAGLDFATLGNHEFDFGVDVLLQRMSEARFEWVVSNVIDTASGAPIGGAVPYVVRTVGGLRLGVVGLCLSSEGITRDKQDRVRILDPFEAAAKYLPVLKAEGADIIVALTHLTFADDRVLAERFPEIDLIVGGHEHFPVAAVTGRTLISKAGSDAKFVARIDFGRAAGGALDRFYELVPVTSAIPDEPGTAAVVASYESRLGAELEKEVSRTSVPLDGVASRMRASETNLGNLVADAVRAAVDADVAIVNSGGIRGDRVHQPGPLLRRDLVEIHPFGNTVTKLAISGRMILQMLEHGVSRLPVAAGIFPQVSGLRLRVNPRAPPGQRVHDVEVQGVRLDPSKTYTLAVPDFLFHGGDGYGMLADQTVLLDPETGPLMLTALEQFVAGRQIVAAIDGRITIAP